MNRAVICSRAAHQCAEAAAVITAEFSAPQIGCGSASVAITPEPLQIALSALTRRPPCDPVIHLKPQEAQTFYLGMWMP